MIPWHEKTALALGAGVEKGEIDPVALAEHFESRIAELDRDRLVYLARTPDRARAEALAARDRQKRGLRRHALDGVPISWKDLYDSAGTTTTFGSALLRDRVPTRDALVLRRATEAGLICLGKTNLTEFAFSGLGINMTFGTPANPRDAKTPRCPGGSSSGAAASVARGLAPAAIGSDTGGSVRVPASWQGLVGLKTTNGLIPTDGALALSTTYDTVGPLTRDVADAAALFGVLAERPTPDLHGASVAGASLLAPTDYMWDGAEPGVVVAVEAAIERLARAGAKIVRASVPEFAEAIAVASYVANPVNVEAYALWGQSIEQRPQDVYHQILDRMRMGREAKATDAYKVINALGEIAKRYHARVAGFAAVLAPTTIAVAPPIAPLVDDKAAYTKANLAALHNTRVGNLLNVSAVTLPCGLSEGLPVGLMIMGAPLAEGLVLRIARGAEVALIA